MSDIINKMVSEGTVPILTEEGISKAFKHIFKYLTGDLRHHSISRNLILDRHKERIDSSISQKDYLQARKNILWKVVLTLKEDFEKMEGKHILKN